MQNHQHTNTNIILGISPGTRSLGIAIFHNKELVRWQMKLFTGSWSTGKLKRIVFILERIIEENRINCIAVKINPDLHSSESIDLIHGAIKMVANQKHILFYEYSIEELKMGCGKDTPKNKGEMIQMVVEIYPHLAVEYQRQIRIRNPYYVKLFEAVACGICANREK